MSPCAWTSLNEGPARKPACSVRDWLARKLCGGGGLTGVAAIGDGLLEHANQQTSVLDPMDHRAERNNNPHPFARALGP